MQIKYGMSGLILNIYNVQTRTSYVTTHYALLEERKRTKIIAIIIKVTEV